MKKGRGERGRREEWKEGAGNDEREGGERRKE